VKKAMLMIGRVVLWIVTIYILTLLNALLLIRIVKPTPLISVIPALALTVLEVAFVYKSFKRKSKWLTWIMKEKRSKGVTIFGWLGILGSATLLHNLFTIDKRITAWEVRHYVLPESYSIIVKSYGAFSVVAYLIAGISLLKLLKWARVYNIALAIIGSIYSAGLLLIYTAPHIYSQNPHAIIFALSLNLLVLGLIIYFFTRPKVKEQFK